MHFSRRQFVRLLGLAATGLAAPRLARAAQDAASGGTPAASADDVLQRLVEGNRRFVKGGPSHPGRKPQDFGPPAGVQRLKTRQPILAPGIIKGTLKVVGATYELRDGGVTLLS